MDDKAIRVIIIHDKKGRAGTGDCSRDSINKKLKLMIDKKKMLSRLKLLIKSGLKI